MALTERHVVKEVEGTVLADVAGTVASLGFYVVEVLGVGWTNGWIFYIVNCVAERCSSPGSSNQPCSHGE